MATITRVKPAVAGTAPLPPGLKKAAPPANLGLSLPTEPTEAADTFDAYTWLIYGEQGVGKTTFCSHFQDPFFLCFEPGGKAIRMYGEPVPTWKHFVEYIDLLYASPDSFKTVIVDTVDRCYEKCFEHVCKREGMKHPNEKTFGEGWKAISGEYGKQLDRLMECGRGVVFLSHVDTVEFQARNGTGYNKLVPSVSKSAMDYLKAPVDMAGYYGYYGEDRYLTIQGSDQLYAKCRAWESGHYLTTSGEHLHSIPMGSSSQESYDNVLSAFNNEYTDPNVPRLKAALSEVKKPVQPKRAAR